MKRRYKKIPKIDSLKPCINCKYFNKAKFDCNYPGPGVCVLIDKEEKDVCKTDK